MIPEIVLFGTPYPTYWFWGIVTGIFYAAIYHPIARRAGIGWWDYWKTGIVACIALWLGSRLFYDWFEFRRMFGHGWVEEARIGWPWRALVPIGFTYVGGAAMLGLLEWLVGLTPLVKARPGRVLDALAPVTAFSFSVSKIGCILAGCCYGAHTDAWWGVAIRHGGDRSVEPIIPVRGLEIAFSLAVGFAALWILFRRSERWRLRNGTIFAGYLVLVGLARFGFGFLRADYEVQWRRMPAPQWGALALTLAALLVFVALLALRDRSPSKSA